MMKKTLLILISIGCLMLAGCQGSGSNNQVAANPTDTLAPLFTLTPLLSATPFSTRTPLPTFTPIPSETPIPPTPSNTPTLTPTPPIIGIISSTELVNVREGPGTTFSAFRALPAGTGVQVISQNPDGTWFNIRMEDGAEGWVSSRLVFLEATPTPFPTYTPSPDLTSLALGTPLPTALLGGGTITPTPPRSAVTATPVDLNATAQVPSEDETPTPTQPFLPIIDINAINQTATALAAGVISQISPPAPAATGQSPNSQPDSTSTAGSIRMATLTPTPSGGVPAQASNTPAVTPPTPLGSAAVQQAADVFAMCDNPAFGIPAPTNLAAGSTIDVFWAWFVTDADLIEQHLNAVTYEVRVNGRLLSNWQEHGQRTIPAGNGFAKYWYVPFGPLEAGTYTITYRATWSQMITDGYDNFGPGSRNPVEEGSCTFVVR